MLRTSRAWLLAPPLALALGGCSSNPLTTGSLFGGSNAAAPVAAPQVQNDPVSRAMQVGTTAARAQKCGFYFDPVKLRTQFLAAESAQSPDTATLDKVAQVYDTSYRGLSRAVSGQGEGYCSGGKVAQIKDALTRHLAGDYTPSPPAPPPPQDEGLFGNLGSSSSSSTGVSSAMQRHPDEW